MIKDADVFIGVSGIGGLLTTNMIKSMNNHPIIFALSNLDSEDITDDINKISSEELAKNRAQNRISGDTDDTDDINQTLQDSSYFCNYSKYNTDSQSEGVWQDFKVY
jgi:malic enzyme